MIRATVDEGRCIRVHTKGGREEGAAGLDECAATDRSRSWPSPPQCPVRSTPPHGSALTHWFAVLLPLLLCLCACGGADASAAAASSGGPSSFAGRVELKKLNAVALWSWDIEVDNCAICRNLIMVTEQTGTATRNDTAPMEWLLVEILRASPPSLPGLVVCRLSCRPGVLHRVPGESWRFAVRLRWRQ